MVEGKINTHIGGSVTFIGVNAWVDLDNSLDITYSWNNAGVVCHEMIAGSRSQIAAPLGMGGAPYWFRLYWNKSALSQTTKEGHTITANSYRMYWSRDGVGWNQIWIGSGYNRALPFTPTRIGVFDRSIGTATSTSRFDYLELWEYAAEPPNLNVPYDLDTSSRQYHHPYPLSDHRVQGNFDGVTTNIDYGFNRELDLGETPYLDNRVPAPSAYPVDPEALIRLDIIDNDTNLLDDTIEIYVNGSLAYDGYADSILSPYNGIDSYTSNISLGKHVTLDYTGNFDSYEQITVRAVAQDDLGNVLDTTYSFRADDSESVLFTNIAPGESLTDVDKDAVISVDLYDKGIGVDPYSVDAYVEGQLAFEGSTQTFHYPYNGPQSEIVYTPVDGYDGYRLKIDRVGAYPSYETVEVRIIGYDKEGN
jgi:hypothetical protein